MHRLLADPSLVAMASEVGAAAVKTAADAVLGDARARIAAGDEVTPSLEALAARVRAHVEGVRAGDFIGVVNATGILLHTNLGRAPLASQALEAIAALGGYSNLEFDLTTGARGSRHGHVTPSLRALTGAEDALIVNNCAAAVLLALDSFARGREVVVARNSSIEVGGGFRLPDVLARSGARLVEVGTTNRVQIEDFAKALTPRTALLLRTHPSNFRMEGFVSDVLPRDLAALGRRAGILTFEDLGNGALVDLRAFGLARERTVIDAIADGMDLVAFSGDKLLGGPQAGIVVGKRAPIARMLANPLMRALRVDKSTLAALGATLRLYRDPGCIREIPIYAMLAQTIEQLRERAGSIATFPGIEARKVTVVESQAFAGGGTLPLSAIPSVALCIEASGVAPGEIVRLLRACRPPIVGRVQGGNVLLDLRSFAPVCDTAVARSLASILGS